MHLAITLCRCMNIPARYCTGYLGDIGVPPAPYPMDFSAWFEAFLGGQWYAFDPRHNIPRIGRVLMARGRDAADAALTTTFGVNQLESFHGLDRRSLRGGAQTTTGLTADLSMSTVKDAANVVHVFREVDLTRDTLPVALHARRGAW